MANFIKRNSPFYVGTMLNVQPLANFFGHEREVERFAVNPEHVVDLAGMDETGARIQLARGGIHGQHLKVDPVAPLEYGPCRGHFQQRRAKFAKRYR
jgi:hypothetical protein